MPDSFPLLHQHRLSEICMPIEGKMTPEEKIIQQTEALLKREIIDNVSEMSLLNDLLDSFKVLYQQNKIAVLNDSYNEKLNGLIRQMKIILDNIPVGIVIVDENRLVTPSYSTIMHRLFRLKKIAGMFVEDVLYWDDNREKERKTFIEWMKLVFDISHDWDLIGGIGPEIIEYDGDDGTIYYNVNYQRIVSDGKVNSLMIYIVDVTEKMRQKIILQEKTAQHNFELEIFTAITGQENSSEIADFIFETKDTLAICGKLLNGLKNEKERFAVCNDIFRHMHSIKGLARTYGMNEFARHAHQTEDILSSIRSGDILYETGSIDETSVADKLTELVALMESLLEKAEGILKKFVHKGMDAATAIRKRERSIKISYDKIGELTTLCDTIAERNEKDPDNARRDLLRLKNILTEISLQPFDNIYKRLTKIVSDVSSALNKKVEIITEGESLLLPYRTHHLLVNALLHLLRNALDHGLETPERRKTAGKNVTGKILIKTERNGDQATIIFSDDGAGINPDMIGKKAIEEGLVTDVALQEMDDEEKLNLILLPGLSCRYRADEISGRGVGMDVVSDALNQIGGTLKIESELNTGTRFFLTFPHGR